MSDEINEDVLNLYIELLTKLGVKHIGLHIEHKGVPLTFTYAYNRQQARIDKLQCLLDEINVEKGPIYDECMKRLKHK